MAKTARLGRIPVTNRDGQPTPMPDTLRSTKLREVGDKARELVKLKEHPSWEILRQEFEIRKQTYLAQLARKFAAGGIDGEVLNQREIDYSRGFLRGAQAVLDTPDNAIGTLEKELRKEANV